MRSPKLNHPNALASLVKSLSNLDEASIAHASDVGGDADVEMEDSLTAEDAYASTKAMGDQDRKVSAL